MLEFLALGHTNNDVAAAVFLSPETVKSHVRSAMRKLGARTRTHAVVIALETGLIEPASRESRERAA
jgi:DNA-binding NarL/FixJ family response regulator